MDKLKIFVTGGGGFVGRHFAAQAGDLHDIVLMCRTQRDADEVGESTGCSTVAADLREIEEIREVLHATRPDVIVHAAGMKSVAEGEARPLECADANVIGSQSVGRVALEIGCPTVLGLSSTRAAPPTSDTYGLSKAIMERMFCSLNDKSDTMFGAIRLGNVVWSDGSVLAEWERMLAETGVIGTTGASSRRFFITVDEAVESILDCLEHIDEVQGRVVARKMGYAPADQLLAAFVEKNGGRWEQLESLPGDKEHEILIGDLELPYCREVDFGGRPYYVLSFNDGVQDPPSEAVTTETAEALSSDEITQLVSWVPSSAHVAGGSR